MPARDWRPVFDKQGYHYSILVILVAATLLAGRTGSFSTGQSMGLPAFGWFCLGIAGAALHQIYVWFCWRTELHTHLLSRLLGRRAFIYYSAVFVILADFRYFALVGADHFDDSYRRKPLVKRGIFQYSRNSMYTFGFLLAWIPGLLAASSSALLLALFNHLYIWVHYYTTEKPDMARIYGKGV